jgi:hypothetical protein
VIFLKYIESRFRVNNPSLAFPLLIIESDDWGFLRVPSREVRDDIQKEISPLVLDPYIQFDGMENKDDMSQLFNLLSDIKDCDGNSCVITANFIMKNPDFFKIENSGFSEFFSESFIDTYKRFHGNDETHLIQKEAQIEGIFMPQFHGLYHININRWMQSLRKGDFSTLGPFKRQMISYQVRKINSEVPCVNYLLDANNPSTPNQLGEVIENNIEGLQLFEKIWGFKSRTIISPCYIWHSSMEPALKKYGVLGFQGQRLQREPRLKGNVNDLKRVYHYQGEKNAFGQFYFIREAFFEPSLQPGKDFVGSALKQVNRCLKRHGFATLCIHRLNFMGSLDKTNRHNNLRHLRILLTSIINKWPNIRFISSDRLIHYYLDKV